MAPVLLFFSCILSPAIFFIDIFDNCRPPTVPLAYSQPKGERLARFARYRARQGPKGPSLAKHPPTRPQAFFKESLTKEDPAGLYVLAGAQGPEPRQPSLTPPPPLRFLKSSAKDPAGLYGLAGTQGSEPSREQSSDMPLRAKARWRSP